MASDDREELDPSEIARADFPTAFRGYDQEAVRQYLSRVAVGMGRAQKLGLMGSADSATAAEADAAKLRADEAERRADEVGQDLAESQSRAALLEQQLEESASRNDASAAADVGRQLDESELIEQVAHDTAGIVKAARSSAAEIVTRAEDEAKRIAADAEADAGRIHTDAEAVLLASRSEADNALAAARTEADDAVAKANAEAKKTQTRVKAEAKRNREQAKVRADKTVAEASKKAESEITAARQRAHQVVADAEQRREEILGDLVRRRRVDQAQLDRLAAARDQLARALSLARGQLDDIAADIDFTDSSAVDIDLTATGHLDFGQTEVEVGELVAELQEQAVGSDPHAGSHAGFRNGDAVAGDDVVVATSLGGANGDVAVITTPPPSPPAPPTPPTPASSFDYIDGSAEENGSENGQSFDVTADPFALALDDGTSLGDPLGDIDSELNGFGTVDDDVTGEHEFELDAHDPEAEHVATEPLAIEPLTSEQLASEHVAVEHLDDDVSSTVASDLALDEGSLVGEETPNADAALGTAEAVLGFNGPIDGDRLLDQLGFAPEPVLGTGAGSMYRSATRGDLPRNTPFNGRLPEAFEARDVALARSTAGFRRRLKRAVNDDQSDVLDRLRAGKRTIEVEELPPLEEQLERYVVALQPPLTEMLTAGGELLDRSHVPLAALDNLCLQLAKHIIHNLRLPTIDAIDAAVDNDREAILDPVRAIYRDFRNMVLPDLIEDALHEAYALGLFNAIDPSDPVVWVIDPRLDADPICEENSASPPLVRGVNFPSGHPRPLSMPGCRCLAIPGT